MTRAPRSFVAYYRVSTKAQAASGLGEEAQRHAVREFVERSKGRLSREFTEVESGKLSDRPVLKQALRLCQSLRAVLVIAKLDRLARNVYFVSNLMESRVEFIATDMPSATKLTIHLLAAIAEHESDMISIRTKDALREAKRRGRVLGNPTLHLVREKGLRTSLERANTFASRMRAPLLAVLNKGIQSYPRIANELNDQGFVTRRGCFWTPQAVKNLIKRLDLGAIESCTQTPS